MDEHQASIADLRISLEAAQRNRAIWEGIANLLNQELKDELGPIEYATRYGQSALSVLFDQVQGTIR
jgi:hypothetical protein